MAFFGFHPHHEGLMLATLNLTSDAIRNGDPLPFNQYGPLWALPYLVLDLLRFDEYTFLAQRLTSILLIFLSGNFTRKISMFFFSQNTSLMISCIFLLSYPYGQPSIIWPSVPAQLFLLTLTYYFMKMLDTSRGIYLVIVSVATLFLIGSRLQIGILSFICACFILVWIGNFKLLHRYIICVLMLLLITSLVLFKLKYLGEVIFDNFAFPTTYLDPNAANWNLPRTSILIATVITSLLFFLTKQRRLEFKYGIVFALLVSSFGILLINQVFSLTDYHKFYARWYVAIYLVCTLGTVTILLKRLFTLRKVYTLEMILFSFSLAGSAQIFPLFDVFHSWYASTPMIISSSVILSKFTRNFLHDFHLNKLLLVITIIYLVVSFGMHANTAISGKSVNFPSSTVKGILLSPSQARDMENQFSNFENLIPKHARILNLCENADPFFLRQQWYSSSRFFLYWPSLSKLISLDRALSETDFVTKCIDTSELDERYILVLQNDFSRVSFNRTFSIWGLRWEIYERVSR